MGKYEKYRGVSRHVGGPGYRRVLGPMALMAEHKVWKNGLLVKHAFLSVC